MAKCSATSEEQGLRDPLTFDTRDMAAHSQTPEEHVVGSTSSPAWFPLFWTDKIQDFFQTFSPISRPLFFSSKMFFSI
jgi:hypothetical protein